MYTCGLIHCLLRTSIECMCVLYYCEAWDMCVVFLLLCVNGLYICTVHSVYTHLHKVHMTCAV